MVQGIRHRAERQSDTANDPVFLHRGQHNMALPTNLGEDCCPVLAGISIGERR
jgi:hypothetical protein